MKILDYTRLLILTFYQGVIIICIKVKDQLLFEYSAKFLFVLWILNIMQSYGLYDLYLF